MRSWLIRAMPLWAFLAARPAHAQMIAPPAAPRYLYSMAGAFPAAAAREATGRSGFLLGAGLGGGRMQDSITGYAGTALDLHAGYAPMSEFALIADADGLFHSLGDGGSLVNAGVALSVEGRVAGHVRLSAGGGYYWLTHQGSPGAPSRTLESPGGEIGLGVELYQATNGFSLGLFARNQMSFPSGQFVDSAFALVGIRCAGLGGHSEPPGPAYGPPYSVTAAPVPSPLQPTQTQVPYSPWPPQAQVAAEGEGVPPPRLQPPTGQAMPWGNGRTEDTVTQICVRIVDDVQNTQYRAALQDFKACLEAGFDEFALYLQQPGESLDACVERELKWIHTALEYAGLVRKVSDMMPDAVVNLPPVRLVLLVAKAITIGNLLPDAFQDAFLKRASALVCDPSGAERARLRHGTP